MVLFPNYVTKYATRYAFLRKMTVLVIVLIRWHRKCMFNPEISHKACTFAPPPVQLGLLQILPQRTSLCVQFVLLVALVKYQTLIECAFLFCLAREAVYPICFLISTCLQSSGGVPYTLTVKLRIKVAVANLLSPI